MSNDLGEYSLRDKWKVWVVKEFSFCYKVALFSNTNYNYYIPFIYNNKKVDVIK